MERKTKWIAGGALAVALIGGGTGVAVAGDVFGDDDDAPLTGSTLDEATAAALAETGGGTVTDTEHDDGRYEVEITLDDGTQMEVTLDDTFAVVGSEADDDDAHDAALTGATLEQATAAALAETGGGTVTDTEEEADGGYEVEVILDDGTEVDVHLDDDFEVTGTDTDTDDDGETDD